MGLIDVRDLLEFPSGDNSSDTLISGVHFNLTTLKHWNYTYYTNGTFSNGSNCFLTFDQYTPKLLANGTFLNSTSCYTPIDGIKKRAIAGLTFGSLLGISIMFTFINLRKHGRHFLPAQKRFRPIGRRWMWYWMLVVAALGMISGISSIDVDRYYLPEFPLILTNLTWFIMLPAMMASVWEGVRHWGSWQERQVIDPNPFSLGQDDRRGKTEFYMPLVFYLFCFLNFFMTIPRGWTAIELQRSPEQQASNAKPVATDIRFKAAAFLLFLSWLVICFSLWHSLHHYKPRSRGLFRSFVGFFRYTPVKFLLTIPLALVLCGYAALCAFDFSVSPLNVDGNVTYIYGLGWTPITLIVLIYEVCGYIDPNEDKELIRQRRVRGAEIDAEMGYTKKPNWWSRLHSDHNLSMADAITRNVKEVSGRRDAAGNGGSIELGDMPTSPRQSGPEKRYSNSKGVPESVRVGASLLFPTPSGGLAERADPFADSGGRGRFGSETVSTTMRGTSERSTSTASGTTLNGPPQQIRSMLDV